MVSPRPSPIEPVLAGDTEMARRIRAHDWALTPLGPIEAWPPSLRTTVSICLDCAFPMFVWWGPTLATLYNDEYIPVLGPRSIRTRSASRPRRFGRKFGTSSAR